MHSTRKSRSGAHLISWVSMMTAGADKITTIAITIAGQGYVLASI